MKSEQRVEKHFKDANLLEGFKKNEEKIIMEYVIVNKILTEIAKKNNIYVVRLEDIGAAPLKEFKQIYEYLDIPFTKKVRRGVITHTKNSNTNSRNLSDIKRDSASTINRWKKELSSEEKDFIKRRTYQYFKEKYPAETWK